MLVLRLEPRDRLALQGDTQLLWKSVLQEMRRHLNSSVVHVDSIRPSECCPVQMARHALAGNWTASSGCL